MRNMNCRNIQREIEEAGSADLLSASAISHLEACVACETLSRRQTRLQAIISSLGTVEAPGDFDFRLRARLAGEGRGRRRSLPFANLSFGLRFAAVAAMLLLIGSAFLLVSFRGRPNNPAVAGGGKQITSQPTAPDSPANPIVVPESVRPDKSQVANAPKKNELNGTPKRRLNSELATYRKSERIGTRDMSSTGARVMKRDDQLAESYPTAAFPINASYQSHKVSVDNGRGTSRTISLPSVSFGSQRTLSQTPFPLIASARDAW
ncbi:MAG: hypothetical protein ABJA18_10665 [bacterium]